MSRGPDGPGGGTPLVPKGGLQLVRVAPEVAVIHQDLQELVLATRDLVQVAKEINNALVGLVLTRKEDPDGIGGTA
mgnify:CR=1 FL=1